MIPKSGYRFSEEIMRHQEKYEVVMNLIRKNFALLALATWAATLAQADARPRGGKHPANAAAHVGTHHQPAAKGRGNASPAVLAPARNAIGVTTQPAAVGASGPAKGTGVVVKPNAIDTHIGTNVVPRSMPAGTGNIGSTTNPANAVRAVPVPSAPPAHAGGINGTGMARPNTTLGTIGGPAKVAGGISGTGMQKKK
jgi:hypothetical protein